MHSNDQNPREEDDEEVEAVPISDKVARRVLVVLKHVLHLHPGHSVSMQGIGLRHSGHRLCAEAVLHLHSQAQADFNCTHRLTCAQAQNHSP